MGMPRDPRPKRRFILTLLLIHLVALPLISSITYLILRENAARDAYAAGKLYLSTIEAMRHYVAEDLRPLFYRMMPGKFVVEGMSRAFVASHVSERVQRDLPNYRYKHASLNPRNPSNKADAFETGMIERFRNEPQLKEWTGFRSEADNQFYVIARSGERFTAECMRCHGSPAAAPAGLVSRYGDRAGFNMKEGALADATFVYIPIGATLAAARKVVAVFIGIYVVMGSVILGIILVRFNDLYRRIESDKGRIEDINIELMNISRDMESIITERSMNLIALSIADRVRNPAAAIAGTISRLLKKEELSAPLRNRLTDLLAEAGKLDGIVKDYESILRSKHTRFRMEDLNELISTVPPLVEDERARKGAELILRLSEEPRRCMINRQVLRVALLHIVKNALEAVPEEGGRVVIETASSDTSVSFTVSDNGAGIPAEEMPNIFNLFYSTKTWRIGMGLPLVKQIVEEHAGNIAVQSEPGRGTSVIVSFPARWREERITEAAGGAIGL